MDQKKAVAALLIISMVVSGSLIQTAIGAVYKVGDTAGWTTIGNVNYKQWAATKTFQLGDTIVFSYNKQFHNVMQVTHANYRSCNISAPINTHSTGNDTIVIKTFGHHYYLCAVPGHCQSGQKLDINVQRVSSTLAPSPSESGLSPLAPISPPTTSSPTSATLNKPNSIAKASSSTMSSLIKMGLVVAVFGGFV